jgi:hypothetical protein
MSFEGVSSRRHFSYIGQNFNPDEKVKAGDIFVSQNDTSACFVAVDVATGIVLLPFNTETLKLSLSANIGVGADWTFKDVADAFGVTPFCRFIGGTVIIDVR